jgi:hypothetical protein
MTSHHTAVFFDVTFSFVCRTVKIVIVPFCPPFTIARPAAIRRNGILAPDRVPPGIVAAADAPGRISNVP